MAKEIKMYTVAKNDGAKTWQIREIYMLTGFTNFGQQLSCALSGGLASGHTGGPWIGIYEDGIKTKKKAQKEVDKLNKKLSANGSSTSLRATN